MKKHLKGMALILICITGLNTIGNSHPLYSIKEMKGFDIKLLGTSTMHDWEMDALSTTGDVQFVFKSGSESDLVSIKSLSFAVRVEDLKSDNKVKGGHIQIDKLDFIKPGFTPYKKEKT